MRLIYIAFYVYLPVLAAITTFSLGLIVVASEVKQTKFIGLNVICSSLNALISSAYALSSFYYFWGMKVNDGVIEAIRYAGIILSLAASVFICIYIHKNYKKRFVYIPVIAVPFVVDLLFSVILESLNKSNSNSFFTTLPKPLLQNVVAMMTATFASVVLIVVFYKNREIEKVIPHTYILLIVSLITSFIVQAVNVLYNVLLSKSGNVHVVNVHGVKGRKLIERLFSFTAPARVILKVIATLVSLAFPIYLLIMVHKAAKKAAHKTESVMPEKTGISE